MTNPYDKTHYAIYDTTYEFHGVSMHRRHAVGAPAITTIVLRCGTSPPLMDSSDSPPTWQASTTKSKGAGTLAVCVCVCVCETVYGSKYYMI